MYACELAHAGACTDSMLILCVNIFTHAIIICDSFKFYRAIIKFQIRMYIYRRFIVATNTDSLLLSFCACTLNNDPTFFSAEINNGYLQIEIVHVASYNYKNSTCML